MFKKFLCLFLVIILSVTLLGCLRKTSYKNPFDYGDALWVCDNPRAYFIVNTNSTEYVYQSGQIMINDKIYPFELYFEYANYVNFYFEDNSLDFTCDCEFGKGEVTMNIEEGTKLFGEQKASLTFKRTTIKTVTLPNVNEFLISEMDINFSADNYIEIKNFSEELNVGEIKDSVDASNKAIALWNEYLEGVFGEQIELSYGWPITATFDKKEECWIIRSSPSDDISPLAPTALIKANGDVISIGLY